MTVTQEWLVGQVRIKRLVESEDTSMRAEVLLPDAVPENVLPIKWLRPNFIDEQGNLITSIFSLLVDLGHSKLVVDTCVGNDKQRIVPSWNLRQDQFIEQMCDAGFPPDRVDFVVCTHLHADHVGWNTTLVDGQWRPTFPNARYFFSQADWDWLDNEPVSPLGDWCGDSVRPIVDAGLAELIRPPHPISTEVSLDSTPGHSPGHVSVSICSEGQRAVITGDLLHHPCQLAKPEWGSPFDFDSGRALQTRREFLEQYGDEPVLVIGSHFATPTAGRIVSDGGVYRLDSSMN